MIELLKKENSQKILSWFVHLYTALGGIIAIFALLLAAEGKTIDAFLLLFITVIIDSTDGLMARKLKVWEKLPNFDGAMMDNVIDMFTYAWIPIFIMGKENLLPSSWWLILPIIASLYAYGQVNMKTEDNFFLGFPTYWNFVALYLYLLQPSLQISAIIIIFFTVLSFLPTRYLYTSKNDWLRKPLWLLNLIWFVMILVILLHEHSNKNIILVSLYYPVIYIVLSFFVEFRVRKKSKFSNK